MDQPAAELPLESTPARPLRLRLIGVGGGGTNAVDRLHRESLDRLQLAVVNTDLKALQASPVADKVLLGSTLTCGLSAGGDPALGARAAETDRDRLAELVRDTDLVFLAAGLGGGTGSGATPVLAAAALEAGALVIAFVTLPFSFEGGRRRKQAEEALAELRSVSHAVIPLANDLLLQEGPDQASVLDAFARADLWISRGVKSVWGLLARTGLINVDFAALRQSFPQRGGRTLFGVGLGAGENPARAAFDDLRLCPLLRTPEFARKTDRLLVNITGGPDLSLARVNELMTAVTEEFGKEAHVIMGALIDERLAGQVEVCVLGTSEAGGRPLPRPVPAPGRRVERRAAPAAVPEAAGPGAAKPLQEEFGFGGAPVENRGAFDKSDRNLFEGQDLDVPTFLRKGIKVSV